MPRQALSYGTGLAFASEPGLARAQAISRAAELPIRATHRTTMVLRAIAQAPYSNNREIAEAAGLADEGQTSKLLARLERQGVIENVGVGAARGEPNAWLLTPSGQDYTRRGSPPSATTSTIAAISFSRSAFVSPEVPEALRPEGLERDRVWLEKHSAMRLIWIPSPMMLPHFPPSSLSLIPSCASLDDLVLRLRCRV